MSVVGGRAESLWDRTPSDRRRIMPWITTGNTMAPCVIIGERAAEIITPQHRL
jgi:choline dehydrogenase